MKLIYGSVLVVALFSLSSLCMEMQLKDSHMKGEREQVWQMLKKTRLDMRLFGAYLEKREKCADEEIYYDSNGKSVPYVMTPQLKQLHNQKIARNNAGDIAKAVESGSIFFGKETEPGRYIFTGEAIDMSRICSNNVIDELHIDETGTKIFVTSLVRDNDNGGEYGRYYFNREDPKKPLFLGKCGPSWTYKIKTTPHFFIENSHGTKGIKGYIYTFINLITGNGHYFYSDNPAICVVDNVLEEAAEFLEKEISSEQVKFIEKLLAITKTYLLNMQEREEYAALPSAIVQLIEAQCVIGWSDTQY